MYVLFIRLFVHDVLLARFIYRSIKPRPNDHNISTQHIACNIVGSSMLHVFGHHVAMCGDMSGATGSNLKMVKFFIQLLWMLHDIVWPRSCNSVAPWYAHCSIFNTQHLATPPNRVAKRVQHVAPSSVALCRVQML